MERPEVDKLEYLANKMHPCTFSYKQRCGCSIASSWLTILVSLLLGPSIPTSIYENIAEDVGYILSANHSCLSTFGPSLLASSVIKSRPDAY